MQNQQQSQRSAEESQPSDALHLAPLITQLRGRSRTAAIRLTLRSSIRSTWYTLWRVTQRFANAWHMLVLSAMLAAAQVVTPATYAGGGITATVTNDVLTVTGTAAADSITITSASGNVKINGNDPSNGATASNSLTSIVINADAGADTIDISQALLISFGTFLNGNGLEINAGAGDDTIIASPDMLGSLNGGADQDVLQITADGEIVLSATTLQVNGAPYTMSYASIERAELNGGAGVDRLDASAANIPTTLNGGANPDILIGGSADDTFLPGIASAMAPNFSLAGTSLDIVVDATTTDNDILMITANSDIVIDSFQISGSNINVVFNGFIEELIITGGTGNNTLDATNLGSTTKLTLIGLEGNDTLIGSAGNNFFEGGPGNDTITGNNGTDTLRQTADADMELSDILLTGQGNDTLSSIEKAILTGGAGNNTINASAFSGSVVIDGAGGNDTISSGAGDDTLDGGPGTDTFSATGDTNMTLTNTTFSAGSGPNTMAAGGTDSLANFEAANLTGGASNNTINAAGFSGPVTLNGLAGDDTLTGGPGDDTLIGGPGQDTLDGGGGINTTDEYIVRLPLVQK